MKALKQCISLLRQNRDLNNVMFGLLSYFITPIVLLVSTPLLLKYLGSGNYGIWVLINSIVAFMTFSNFGLGNALIKLGAEYLSDTKESKAGFNRLFNVTFTLSILVSLVILAVVFAFGPYLLQLLAKGHPVQSTLSLSYMLGAITVLKILNSVIAASFMSKQRYDLNSKINIAVNLMAAVTYTVLAVQTKSLQWLVGALLLASLILLFISAVVAKRILPELRYSLRLDRSVAKKVIRYGLYTWSQAINTTLLGQVDKLIIGGILGPSVLGYYSVCMTLVFKIHEIPVAAGGFLLAKFSSLHETDDTQKIRRVYRIAFIIKSIFIICSAAFVILLAKPILSIWISPLFANQHYELLQLLTVGVSSGAFIVIPYYCLNGTGYVRSNSIIAFLISIVTIGVLYILVPQYGPYGMGIGKIASFPLVLYAIYLVERYVIRNASHPSSQKLEALN